MSEAWAPDILGAGFERLTLPLGADDDGAELVATLVRSIPHPFARLGGVLRDVDVLYVHGWSDYFFQTELARFWTERGARFHALDLRGYGRSLRPGQVPGDMRSLADYDADIGAALEAMGWDAARRRRLVLLGHSTGGLVLTLWAARHPGVADAVVLNSPWLEFQVGAVGRQALAPIVNARARFDPYGSHPVVDLGFYTRAQREVGSLPDSPKGWRPPQGFPTHPAWLAAILEGHRRVALGVDVGAPALVLLSARSILAASWHPDMTDVDSVLVVDDIARRATRIAETVTIARIDGALHDVFLSRPRPRQRAYAELERFVRSVVER
ncbi:alpha/beta hydrolase [Microbacterium sp. Gd 4-13]|uniref:alpha/beta hydrolase n=1 Tax=Microbacterium sp. Gd 4-13 TaxID=2173179 RepID=UPI000D56F38B|nr:alpha/beta hydrolase [Microbacterium sp. Gd 4-13]PVW04275.1 alpha/beta hydrolase [Microbacterium sp. Gd 4-13]